MKTPIFIFFSLFITTPAYADFIVDNPISFGEIVVRSNNSVSTLILGRNGTERSTNDILILRQGSPGVFTLNGIAPYTNITLSVDLPAYSSMAYANTAQFSITAVDHQSTINMGSTGSVQFKMGATLSTSGNPAENYYSGADYLLFLNLNLNY